MKRNYWIDSYFYQKFAIITIIIFILFLTIFVGYSTQNVSKNSNYPIYNIDEEGISGNWSIKVLNAYTTNNIKTEDASKQVKTNEEFIIVSIQMKNLTDSTLSYTSREFMIMDKNSKIEYDINNLAFNAMRIANKKATNELEADAINQTCIIFQVPKDASINDYLLINKNGNGVPTGFNLK